MKILYHTLLLYLFAISAFAQDMVYFVDGKNIPGKVIEIGADKIKLYNPNSEGNSYEKDQTLLAFNSMGDYLVIVGNQVNENEKNTFLKSNKGKLSTNIIINKSGEVIEAESFFEEGADMIYIIKGEEKVVKIQELAALIRRNGTHKLFVNATQAIVPLKVAKPKITAFFPNANDQVKNKQDGTTASIASTATTIPTSAPKLNIQAPPSGASDVKFNMEAFSKKALQKTDEFANYLTIISGVNVNRDKAKKSIDMACALFQNDGENSRVEVSSANTQEKNKYKVREYLNRLQFKSGQYDKIIIDYAEISYASEFKKGADGNYYGVVTFVQKFRGFVDGEMVYGDITKKNLSVMLKRYEKSVEGQTTESWDVLLADIGVVETKKL